MEPMKGDINSDILYTFLQTYHPFHKTLPRYSAFGNWISVRFYETDCK